MRFVEKRLKSLTRKIRALYLCMQDPETPWIAKAIALITVAYAVSPLDLIPDWIPVLGYLDDLLILPLLIALVIHLTPREVYLRHLDSSFEWEIDPRIRKLGLGITIIIWVCIAWVILSSKVFPSPRSIFLFKKY